MRLSYRIATAADAPEIVRLRIIATERLNTTCGRGHWSDRLTEKGVLLSIRQGRVLLARRGKTLVGTLTLTARKPWAIIKRYFTQVPRALYLVNMAVVPTLQRAGVGRALLTHASQVARAWPADAIRLDAYDAVAGAGGFYASCGYTEVGRANYRSVRLIYYERAL